MAGLPVIPAAPVLVQRAQFKATLNAGGGNFILGSVVCESYIAPFAGRGAPPAWTGWAAPEPASAGRGGTLRGAPPLRPAGAEPMTPIMKVRFTNLPVGFHVGPMQEDSRFVTNPATQQGFSYTIRQGGFGTVLPIDGGRECARIHIVALSGTKSRPGEHGPWLDRRLWDGAHSYALDINYMGGANAGDPIVAQDLCAVYLVSSIDPPTVTIT